MRGGGADRQHFSMSRRVFEFERAVACPRDDCARRINDDCAHGNFTAFGGGFGFGQSKVHRGCLSV